MKFIRLLFKPLLDFFIRYPAVLSGMIIYLYFLVATLDFFSDVKSETKHGFDLFQNFDALIWMWLLAWVLVKVIDLRGHLARKEKETILHQQELQLRQTQLKTMQEVVRSLQHDINNPLTIILAYVRRIERHAKDKPEILQNLREIKEGAERISRSLLSLSQARGYTTEESPVGPLAKPGDHP